MNPFNLSKYKSKLWQYRTYIFLGIITTLIISMLGYFLTPSINLNESFIPQKLPLHTYDLYDLSVTDINQDGFLDIFTTNHSAQQSLLLNNKNGTFKDSLISRGLSQDPNFPKLEISDQPLEMQSPGLYIYRKEQFRNRSNDADNVLVLSAQDMDEQYETGTVQGTLELLSTVKIKHQNGFSLKLTETPLSNGITKTKLHFIARKNSKLILASELTAVPISLKLDPNLPLDSVHIGFNHQAPKAHEVTLKWKDRHGMAWADFDRDGDLDVFISRGGLKGKISGMENYSDENLFRDELFKSQNGIFQAITPETDLKKKNCPGRQTAWVDFDNNGLLDLYTVCGRGTGPLAESPNQLYKQTNPLQFDDVASQVGLSHPEQGSFTWVDLDNDHKSDFLWASRNLLQVYRNQSEGFEIQQQIPHQKGDAKKLSVVDYDSDGDLDVFILGNKGSLTLVNSNGRYDDTESTALGLPRKATTVHWIDYNQDGLLDLHAVPHGLFIQNKDHTFRATHLLKNNPRLSKIVDARCTWFDADNDGTLDLLLALRHKPLWLSFYGKVRRTEIPDPRGWSVTQYKGTRSPQKWLELDLVGLDSNRQAIGSQVLVKTQDTIQRHYVGESEGGHYSQGNYRIYVTLKPTAQIEELTVIWPDGTQQTLEDIPTNQILQIQQAVT